MCCVVYTSIKLLNVLLRCGAMSLGNFTAQIRCEVIIGDLLSGLSWVYWGRMIHRLDHAGVQRIENWQPCHTLRSFLLMLMLFSLKWLPIIVFLLSCLPDVISPAKWQKEKKKNHASGHLLDLTVILLPERSDKKLK